MEIVERIVMAVLLLILLILWVVDIEKRQKRNDRVTEQIEDLANTINKSQKGERMPYIDVFKLMEYANNTKDRTIDANDIARFPRANVQEVKHGKWTEKEVIHKEEAKDIIEEWQTCNCSVCGRYDTRPYLYFFDEPRFCSWCGADMRGGTDG